jgi:serine/threonine-protein kinase
LTRPVKSLLLLALIPTLLALSACDDVAVPGDSNSFVGTSPTPVAQVVKPTPKPKPKPKPVAKPVPKPVPKPKPATDPYAAATASGATAVCADGTWSFSQNRSGTCSHHGGVHWWTGNLGAPGPGAH